MKILIVSGFLGSGKTTLLSRLARFMVENSGSSVVNKVVILENEIGTESIDGKLLEQSGLKVDNLFSGCVCCSMAGELLDSVKTIEKQLNPEWLIVETTGLAYPAPVVENLWEHAKIKARVCVVTDAFRWKKIRIPLHQLLKGQIEAADIVLLNKIDLVEDEILDLMKTDILEMNKEAYVIPVCASSDLNPPIFEKILD